jgi:hypothetical protein
LFPALYFCFVFLDDDTVLLAFFDTLWVIAAATVGKSTPQNQGIERLLPLNPDKMTSLMA